MVGSSLGCKYYTRVELKATIKLQIDTSKLTTVKVFCTGPYIKVLFYGRLHPWL
jgi:hypothetical protein